MKNVVIVGGGFAGLNAAKALGNKPDMEVTLIDRRNHHLFQPLLYQVAMAGLSPAEIAAPIRSMLSGFKNIRVLKGVVDGVDLNAKSLTTEFGEVEYDYLLLACGAKHTYFGHDDWEENAPGLKNLEQATEIRRRVLQAFEAAECESDEAQQKKLLTFIVVGGGPTGVELAGAIAEMSRHTLVKDFKNIDPKLTRVILIEAGPRILPAFSDKSAGHAMRDIEKLGGQVWTSSRVTKVDSDGVEIGNERVNAATVLWAAGVRAANISQTLNVDLDNQGRVVVEKDLSIKGHPEVFIAGDLAHVKDDATGLLPGIAPVAMQQGRAVARNILNDLKGKARKPFQYKNKGQMATIGRSKAIVEIGKIKVGGFIAWLLWLVVHIYYLTGFKNKLFVVLEWALSYLTYKKGARLIVNKDWKFYQPN